MCGVPLRLARGCAVTLPHPFAVVSGVVRVRSSCLTIDAGAGNLVLASGARVEPLYSEHADLLLLPTCPSTCRVLDWEYGVRCGGYRVVAVTLQRGFREWLYAPPGSTLAAISRLVVGGREVDAGMVIHCSGGCTVGLPHGVRSARLLLVQPERL